MIPDTVSLSLYDFQRDNLISVLPSFPLFFLPHSSRCHLELNTNFLHLIFPQPDYKNIFWHLVIHGSAFKPLSSCGLEKDDAAGIKFHSNRRRGNSNIILCSLSLYVVIGSQSPFSASLVNCNRRRNRPSFFALFSRKRAKVEKFFCEAGGRGRQRMHTRERRKKGPLLLHKTLEKAFSFSPSP